VSFTGPAKRATAILALGLPCLLVPGTGHAQVPIAPIAPTAPSAPTAPAAQTAPGDSAELGARRHFERSLELYRAGRYAEALNELEQAAALDPNGKDLFFNLSLVHEKLGQLPEAIKALERFRELETDRAELERTRITLERLRGAAEAAAEARARAPATAPCPEPGAANGEQAAARPPSALLIGAASAAIVSFAVGAVFGAKALSDDVSDSQTSSSRSVAQVREQARRAEREALIADVAFAIGTASAATFVGVWLLAPTDQERRAAGITLKGAF
jgi:tetratricopeptide (TPR) repeat protein